MSNEGPVEGRPLGPVSSETGVLEAAVHGSVGIGSFSVLCCA